MPASSRKRNKGKDRKAKQQAKKEEIEKARIRNVWLSWTRLKWTVNDCDHGCTVDVSESHLVSKFMDLLFTNVSDDMSVYDIMHSTLQKYPEVWNNDIHRQIVTKIMVRIGTNILLSQGRCDIGNALCVAQSIVALEHYEQHYDCSAINFVINKRVVSSKWRDLSSSNTSEMRDVLKFYRKRTTCKCLKKMHLEARKSTLKMGMCYGCLKEYERPSLLICSRCMIYQYCSRGCQVAHWPVHERDCDKHVSAHHRNERQCVAGIS